MIPLVAAGIASSIGKGLLGLYQTYKASQLARNMPKYYRPKEYEQNLNLSRNMAQQGLPQSVYNQQAGMIDRNLGFGLRQNNTLRGGLSNLGAMVQGANDAYNTLNAQDAQARRLNMLNYQNTLQRGEEYSNKEYQLNEYEPYMRDMAAKQAMSGAGIQNLFGSVQGVGDAMGQDAYMKLLTNFYGGGAGKEAAGQGFGGGISPLLLQKQQPADYNDYMPNMSLFNTIG